MAMPQHTPDSRNVRAGMRLNADETNAGPSEPNHHFAVEKVIFRKRPETHSNQKTMFSKSGILERCF